MVNHLTEHKKFEELISKNDAFVNFAVNQQKRKGTVFKNLVDSNNASKEMRISVKPV